MKTFKHFCPWKVRKKTKVPKLLLNLLSSCTKNNQMHQKVALFLIQLSPLPPKTLPSHSLMECTRIFMLCYFTLRYFQGGNTTAAVNILSRL